ncbi:hypothetical protein GW846_05495 [Candidatus Gracilibacteria bacterium]|nr:hypothetical protein [Candidatus Gracilibacteria bacterium]
MNTVNTNTSSQFIEGIEIIEPDNISSSGYVDVILGLNGKGRYAEREVADFGVYSVSEMGSVFLVESSSYEDIENIRKFWENTFEAKNAIISELKNGREIPKYSGYFQKDGKYYIMGALCYSSDKRNLGEEEGSYNGILWNQEISHTSQKQVDDGANKLKIF